jgi:predicted phage tail protein
MGFAKFMSSTLGRWIRIIAGAALIAIGIFLVGGVWGIVLAVVGAVPFLAGIFDVCVIGALFLRTPFRGTDLRARIEQ